MNDHVHYRDLEPTLGDMSFVKDTENLDRFRKAMDRQEGGLHYKDMQIQPIEFCQKNNLNYCEANAIKYICRHRKKNGAEDIRKAIHNLQILLELEYDV